MIVSIEQHVEWIAACLPRTHPRPRVLREIEPTGDAQAAWVEFVNQIADFTLFPTCNSWYLGANAREKARVFMPYIGFPSYAEKCEEVAGRDYEGFVLERVTTRADQQVLHELDTGAKRQANQSEMCVTAAQFQS